MVREDLEEEEAWAATAVLLALAVWGDRMAAAAARTEVLVDLVVEMEEVEVAVGTAVGEVVEKEVGSLVALVAVRGKPAASMVVARSAERLGALAATVEDEGGRDTLVGMAALAVVHVATVENSEVRAEGRGEAMVAAPEVVVGCKDLNRLRRVGCAPLPRLPL